MKLSNFMGLFVLKLWEKIDGQQSFQWKQKFNDAIDKSSSVSHLLMKYFWAIFDEPLKIFIYFENWFSKSINLKMFYSGLCLSRLFMRKNMVKHRFGWRRFGFRMAAYKSEDDSSGVEWCEMMFYAFLTKWQSIT